MATNTPPLSLPRKWYFLTHNMRPLRFPHPSLQLTPDCNICQSRFLRSPDPEPPVRLRCGHVFGEFCLREWFKKQDTCPMCRERMFKAAPVASLRPAVSLVEGARLGTTEITEEMMAFYRRMRRGGLAVMRARVAESEDKDENDAAAETEKSHGIEEGEMGETKNEAGKDNGLESRNQKDDGSEDTGSSAQPGSPKPNDAGKG